MLCFVLLCFTSTSTSTIHKPETLPLTCRPHPNPILNTKRNSKTRPTIIAILLSHKLCPFGWWKTPHFVLSPEPLRLSETHCLPAASMMRQEASCSILHSFIFPNTRRLWLFPVVLYEDPFLIVTATVMLALPGRLFFSVQKPA